MSDIQAKPLTSATANPELDRFIRQNYDWALQIQNRDGYLQTTVTVPVGGTLLLGGQRLDKDSLLAKLSRNRGQKVTVNSMNVNADASTAEALGVQFNRGVNNVNWAQINGAQFRSLLELNAKSGGWAGREVPANERRQDTIVGTDAFLANGMIANITFAGDKGNTLDVNGNNVNLAHEGYLLIDNGRFLTVVKTEAMQHWTAKPADVGFVKVPQKIEVPRVGRLVRFEKTLIKPADRLVIRVDYNRKGE